ncbi:MAG: GCN5-related N-acetyltransferase [Parcubacteria group bacterium Gr01-1014_33]|nr:MAG: GCN5-related N-acetyltransferase [Parcubacteria group bacterium Gr01-1014_33]
MKEYPSLTTKRLILRGFTPNDAKDIQRLAGDKDIASATLSVPYPYEDGMAEQWISTHQDDLEKGLRPRFAIAAKQDVPYLIGAIGLHIDPEHQRAELGYWIGKPYWGKDTQLKRQRQCFAMDLNNLDFIAFTPIILPEILRRDE